MVLNVKMRLSFRKDCWSDETRLLENCFNWTDLQKSNRITEQAVCNYEEIPSQRTKCKTLYIYLILCDFNYTHSWNEFYSDVDSEINETYTGVSPTSRDRASLWLLDILPGNRPFNCVTAVSVVMTCTHAVNTLTLRVLCPTLQEFQLRNVTWNPYV